jgi:hypothetical protein
LLPPPNKRGRPQLDRRAIIDAILIYIAMINLMSRRLTRKKLI